MNAVIANPVRAWEFDELLREGMALIPAYAPQWTNHNPSDPGITLVELLAYFSEILAYRALRITPDAKLHFLRLLEGTSATAADELRGAPAADIEDAIRDRVLALSQLQCAVTPHDFERLAVAAAANALGAHAVVRAMCMPATDLRRAITDADPSAALAAPGDVSVLLAPEREMPQDALDELCQHVQRSLAPCCLLTTRVHVVGPAYLHLSVGCRIAPRPGVSLAELIDAVDAALRRRFGPVAADEPVADARAFGRTLYLSEIAEVIDRADGVDYVDDITIWRMNVHGAPDDGSDSRVGIRVGMVARPGEDASLGGRVSLGSRRLLRDETGALESLRLQPWELVRVRLARDAVQEIMPGGAMPSAGARRDR